MVLPIYAGMEKLPDSIIDASADLGAKPGRTFLKVILPITWPAIIAGSLFTFSLSLGDYITVQILGGTFQMLGNVVYQNFALNLPFAAAVALIPVIVMFIYLGSERLERWITYEPFTYCANSPLGLHGLWPLIYLCSINAGCDQLI